MSIEDRLKSMGIELSAPPMPAANYVGFVRQGDLVFVSGQIPFVNGELPYKGRLGDGVSLEEGQAAAKACAICVLAQVKAACGGDLEKVQQCIRLGGFVASTPDFHDQPAVINGASDLVAEVLGDRGKHARAAVGVAVLPFNVSVEVEGLFAISD